jgi:hypothetical protein
LKASQKNWGKKNKKTKIFPRVPVTRHSGKRPFPECLGTRGIGHLPRVLGLGTRGRVFSIFFKRLRLLSPSNGTFLFRVPVFPECNSSPSATLGEDCLPRVPDFWHSGKCVALGKDCFSRSVLYTPSPSPVKTHQLSLPPRLGVDSVGHHIWGECLLQQALLTNWMLLLLLLQVGHIIREENMMAT